MFRQNGYGPIDRFCARHPRFGIPNLMMYIVAIQVLVYLMDLITGGTLISLMYFYRGGVLRGQLWRLVTFIFIPSSTSNPFYLLLGCYFYFWIGRMLERSWGAAKFTLFYLSGVVLSILSGMILGYADIYYVNLSIFLVIATLYSEMQVLLFFVIPVKMKWMALLDVALILLSVIPNAVSGNWIAALLPLASFVNYFIFTWPFWSERLGFVRRQADPRVVSFKRARRQAQKQAKATGGYRHKCAVCGVTDVDRPDMEFRYCSKCDGYYCYCIDHINNHIHIHKDT